MKEMDNVRVVVEKEQYAKEGVHEGMYGWICHDKCNFGYWLVNFPQCGEKPDIAEISMKEEDMVVVPVLYAAVNEQIKARFDASDKKGKTADRDTDGLSENISDYLI